MSTLKIDEESELSRDEFADAIAKGLGRTFLYVKDCGLDASQRSGLKYWSTRS